MPLKWDTNDMGLKPAWNMNRLKDAPEGYYDRRSRCEEHLVPRYRKPRYELGSDEQNQLDMVFG